MPSGSFYEIHILHLRNPDSFDLSFYKWVIEVVDFDTSYVYLRSFAATSNYQTTNFQRKLNATYLTYKAAPNGTVLSELNLIRGIVSPYIYIEREESTSFVFARSFELSSANEEVLLAPQEIDVEVGTLNRKVQVYSRTAIGQYWLRAIKTNDGDYY
jgi:hypothetical protein